MDDIMNEAYEYNTKQRLSQALSRAIRPIPEPEDDELIVRVRACAINPVDEQLYAEWV
jgi:NADPH:quinone reductase-like Zn-dependent oxidoreductase